MKAWILKIAGKYLGGLDGSDFDRVVVWVTQAGRNPAIKSGYEEALWVIKNFNATFAKRLDWAVRTVVQIAYAYAKLTGLDT